MSMALHSNTPSSDTLCPPPRLSTYFDPSSSHTMYTEQQLSVSAQLNIQRLSTGHCAFAKPWSIYGWPKNNPLGASMAQRDPLKHGFNQRTRFYSNIIQSGKRRAAFHKCTSPKVHRCIQRDLELSKSSRRH